MHICEKGDDCKSNPMAAVCHECPGDEEAFTCSPCKVSTVEPRCTANANASVGTRNRQASARVCNTRTAAKCAERTP